jgi:hypothetical protein
MVCLPFLASSCIEVVKESISEIWAHISLTPLAQWQYDDRMVAGRGYLKLYINFKPEWEPGIFHSHDVLSLSEVRADKRESFHWILLVLNLRPVMQTTRFPNMSFTC